MGPAGIESGRLEPPPELLQRLRQLAGYTWDESREPFHTSYDIWHVFGTRHGAHTSPTTSLPTSPASENTRPQYVWKRPSRNRQHSANSNNELHDILKAEVAVVARVSVHVLRDERAYHICGTLALTDPNGHHVARPLDQMRLASELGDEGTIVVYIFEDLGSYYLSKVIDYGPAWYHLHLRGENIQGHRNEKYELDSMSLQTFLDFAIGAAECIEALYSQQIVHGEIRGDAFHMNEETGKVKLINLGPGRLRIFEQGLTSNGWSMMSKELGAETKLSFMSPEQTRRMPLEPDSHTDIFSLGVLFWTILVQKPAFEGETLMDIIQAVLGQRLPLISNVRLDIPEVIGRIIEKATSKTVWERYHSMSGLRHDFLEVRRLLSIGDSPQLSNWEIATKDVSPYFNLPQVMVGRDSEHDSIVKVIDRAFKLYRASQRPDKHGLTQPIRLSEDHSTSLDKSLTEVGSFVDDNDGSSVDGRMDSLSLPDAILGERKGHIANTAKQRSPAPSQRDSIDMIRPSPEAISRSSQKWTSTLESPSCDESIISEAEGSISGSDGMERMFVDRNNVRRHTTGRCAVITIEGAAGLGKTRLLQSTQVEARQRGCFASSKFDQTQSENKPFESVLTLLSSLFQQVFSESDIDPTFHQALKRRVGPIWPILHKLLILPEFLLEYSLPSRNSGQSIRSSKCYSKNSGAGAWRRDSSPGSVSSRGSHYLGAQVSHKFLRAGSSLQPISLSTTFLDVLRIFAQYNFVCFCLDDVHLGDEESLELIAQIISSKIKMVVILTYTSRNSLPNTIGRVLTSSQNQGTSLT